MPDTPAPKPIPPAQNPPQKPPAPQAPAQAGSSAKVPGASPLAPQASLKPVQSQITPASQKPIQTPTPQPAQKAAVQSPTPSKPPIAPVTPTASTPAPATPVAVVPTVPAPPVTPPAGSAPAKAIGKEKDVAADKKRFLMGCFGGFLGLFIVFIILMVFVLSRAGADNAVLRAFGLEPSGLRQFLLGVVGLSFGLVSLILLVLTAVGIFRFTGAKKEDKIKRQSGIRLTLFSFFPLLAVLALWLFLYNFVSNLSLQAEAVPAEITVINPQSLANLEAPVEITFSALNVAQNLRNSGLNVERMEWDLDGNGDYETPVRDPEVVQLYTRRGFYNVSLRAYITGEENPRVYQLPISIQQATFKTSPNTGTAPLTVEFDAADLIPTDTRIQRFDWDFDGDGIYEMEDENAEQAEYTFRQIGKYEVHLRMLNAQGNVENYYKTIEVVSSQTPLIEAKMDATPSFEGTLPFQIQFNADRSTSLKGVITSYTWNFGDGSPQKKGKSVNNIYRQSGTFEVQLVVEDDLGNRDEEIREVIVTTSASAPVAAISTTPAFDAETNQLTGNAPLKVMFDASKTKDADNDVVEYAWDFNDDGTPEELGEKVEYTFPGPGQFTVKLTVEDAKGQSSQSTLLVQVTQPPLLAVIEAQPNEGTPPLMISFDGSGSRAAQGRIVSYEWNFGDGSQPTITGANITHQYTKVGNYTAILKVTSDTGEVTQATMPIFIREIPLEACFTPSRKNGPTPLGVSFNVQCATGTIAKYEWDFGDGATGSSYNPSHTFAKPGVYTVKLTVFDSKNNVSTYSDAITAEGQL